jgi:3-hydroxyisobutyrate dehydrogenase
MFQGIITSSARLNNFPTPLISAAEQTYVSGLSRGFGPNDDSGMVRMYYQEPVAKVASNLSPEETASRTKLVTDLLTNVHVCAAAEAVAFAKHLKVDLAQFFELVNNAAGGSRMFESRAADMISGLREDAKAGRTVHNAAQELSLVVQEARKVECPVYLASEALNVFMLARRKGLGGAADSNVLRVWEDCPK